MDINQLGEKYNIDFNQISAILKSAGIKMELGYLGDVPDSWLKIVSDHFNKDDNGQNTSKPEPKEKKQKASSRSSKAKPKKNRKTFYAYVKFVGPNEDHAFVRILSNINSIKHWELREKDEFNYKLQEDCSRIQKSQIISVFIKNEKFKIAKIHSLEMTGTFLRDQNNLFFIDWSSAKHARLHTNLNVGQEVDTSHLFHVGLVYFERYSGLSFLKFDKEIDEESLAKMVYQCFESEVKSNNPNEQIFKGFEKIIEKDSIDKKLGEQFDYEIQQLSQNYSGERFNILVEKWHALKPELLTFGNLETFKNKKELFKKWLKGLLEIDFFGDHLIDAFLNFSDNFNLAEDKEHKSFSRIYKDKIYSELENYVQSRQITNSKHFEILKDLLQLSQLPNSEELIVTLSGSLPEETRFQMWLEGNAAFDKKTALKVFKDQSLEIQTQILTNLTSGDILTALPEVKRVADPDLFQTIIRAIKDDIQKTQDIISFDIESDTESIYELAWNNDETWREFKTEVEVNDGLTEFNSDLEISKGLVIGHNIIDFDYPILEAKGVKIDSERIWDTLKIEVLLSPEMKNFALKTQHSAKQDAQHTLSLFFNQVIRLVTNNELRRIFKEVGNNKQNEFIDQVAAKYAFDWVDIDLDVDKLSFYRPQCLEDKLIEKLKIDIENSDAEYKVILGPKGRKLSVKELANINFLFGENRPIDFEILDLNGIQENQALSDYNKAILKRFINQCDTKNINPFWINLSPFIKNLISKEEGDPFKIFQKSYENSISKKLIYLDVQELIENKEEIENKSSIDFFILQPDLMATTEKVLLKELNQETLNIFEDNSHFWIKFSGGQSYVPLTKEQVEFMNVEVPNEINNYWIEKYQIGKYRIWGNYRWEQIISKLNTRKKHFYKLSQFDFPKSNVNIARIGYYRSQVKDVIRFNQESIHRSRYWVFQKQLIRQISSASNPIILLISQYNEIQVLEDYFRSLGYYVPESSISLGRRLELIHKKRVGGEILIAHKSQIEKILELNYQGELEIVLDSFNLGENFYNSQGSDFFENESKQLKYTKNKENSLSAEEYEGEEEIETIQNKKISNIKDTFFLLKLQLPYINNIRNLISQKGVSHQLWILDSRVGDYPDLINIWNANAHSFRLWENEDLYKQDMVHADKHIPSVKPVKGITLSKEKIKQILSEVFINGHPWRDNQEPYLDSIIDGDKDLFVSLPTGGGKSVLFQGPALLKGSFTNRLTIVVTPLKALMEDQVANLWDKGFHGCVEYLNSDRGTDVRLIYRLMAGGELTLLYVTPERFRSRSFLNALNNRMNNDGGLEYVVFDEAHCISQWGHEFRPDYFNCAKKINRYKKDILAESPLLLFSATVSEKIFRDLNHIFS